MLLYAVLATIGHQDKALEKTLALPDGAFDSAGGGGHSLTNTIWFISSRPPTIPFDLDDPSTTTHSKAVPKSEKDKIIDCGCPDTCDGKSSYLQKVRICLFSCDLAAKRTNSHFLTISLHFIYLQIRHCMQLQLDSLAKNAFSG